MQKKRLRERNHHRRAKLRQTIQMDVVYKESDTLEEDISRWASMYEPPTTSAAAESEEEGDENTNNAVENDDDIKNENNNDELHFGDPDSPVPSSVITENKTNCSKGLGIGIGDGLTRRERKNLKRRESMQCPTCGKTVNRGSMSKHAKTHTRVKKFQCEICGGGYDRQDYFMKHMALHIDKKPYKCTVCGKAFNLIRKLVSHETIHTGLKPFICSICNTSFTESSALYKHMRGMHEGNKPYECSFCGKSFNESAQVKRHMRIHTGEKPFVCPVCSRAFNDRSAQLKHIRSHKGWEAYAVTTYTAGVSGNNNVQEGISDSSGTILAKLLTASNGVKVKKEIESEENYGQDLPPIDSYHEEMQGGPESEENDGQNLPAVDSYHEEMQNGPVVKEENLPLLTHSYNEYEALGDCVEDDNKNFMSDDEALDVV